MSKKELKDVSQLGEWGFKPKDITFGTLQSLERVRIGQLSSHRYKSRINTCLAASHVLSDVTLYQKEQVASTFVTYADLEAVDYQYMLCGLNDGGIAIYDVSSIQEGRIYSEVGLVKGGHRGGHKWSVFSGILPILVYLQRAVRISVSKYGIQTVCDQLISLNLDAMCCIIICLQ